MKFGGVFLSNSWLILITSARFSYSFFCCSSLSPIQVIWSHSCTYHCHRTFVCLHGYIWKRILWLVAGLLLMELWSGLKITCNSTHGSSHPRRMLQLRHADWLVSRLWLNFMEHFALPATECSSDYSWEIWTWSCGNFFKFFSLFTAVNCSMRCTYCRVTSV